MMTRSGTIAELQIDNTFTLVRSNEPLLCLPKAGFSCPPLSNGLRVILTGDLVENLLDPGNPPRFIFDQVDFPAGQ
jgi:hypothetical protein